MARSTVSARISPVAGMDVLSRDEVSRLRDASRGGLHALLRRCALAVLTSGQHERRSAQHARALSGFRRPGAAAGSRHQARADQRAGQRLRRRPHHPRHQRTAVRGRARHRLRRDADRCRPLPSRRFARHHACRVRDPAQRARAASEHRTESGRVLGRPFDTAA